MYICYIIQRISIKIGLYPIENQYSFWQKYQKYLFSEIVEKENLKHVVPTGLSIPMPMNYIIIFIIIVGHGSGTFL